jgi:uncharacterized protein YggT (Ycf19 family)
MNALLQQWYFHLPNFIIAAVMYSLLGRILLSFFVPLNWQNYIWRAFVWITDPFVKLTRYITPAIVPEIVLMIFTVLWLALLRVLIYVVMTANFFMFGV